MTNEQFEQLMFVLNTLHHKIDRLTLLAEKRSVIDKIVDVTHDNSRSCMRVVNSYETEYGMYIEVSK